MLSVLIGLAYVGGAAEHPCGGAAGIGIGCVENGRPLMDRRDDRLVGILIDIAALDDGIFADELGRNMRSEEHTSELQSLMRISYAVFCLKKKNKMNTRLYTLLITDNEILTHHRDINN